MKKLFEYGGKISQQFFVVDTANIKAYDWFMSIKIDMLSDEEKSLVNQLLLNIGINDVRNSITMSDARCKFIASKLMAKYDDLKLVDIDDYTIIYQTLLTIYEKTFVGIDEIIRYVNLLMGYSFSKKELTRDEAIELRDLQNAILDIITQNINNQNDLWITKYIPSFIINSLKDKFDVDDIINVEEKQEKLLDEGEVKKVRKQKQAIDDALSEEVGQAPEVDVTLEDIKEESKEVEKKDVEYKPKGEDLKKIRKFELYIKNLQKLIDETSLSPKDKKEIEEAIDIYKDRLNDVKRGNVYAVGGIVQMFSSPQIVDGMYSVISMFDNGGETNDSGTLKNFVFADGSSFIVHFDNDNGRMVNPKLYKVNEQERVTSILLNKKSLAEVAIDNMNEHNIPFSNGLIRLVKAKVFVKMFDGGGRFNFRVIKDSIQGGYPYYLWDANSGSIISDFKTEQDAMDYIQFATERAKDSQDLKSLSMATLVEEKENELRNVEMQIESNEMMITDYQRGDKSFDNTYETELKMSDVYAELRELRAKKEVIKKDLAHFEKILNSIKDSESNKTFRYDDKTIKQNRIDALNNEIDDLQEIIDMLETQMDIVGENSKTWLNASIDSMKAKLQMLYQDRDRLGGNMFGGGGQSKFEKLSNKVAKNYEGKKVPSEYQNEYGKTYDKEEAKEVGDKVASKVYRLQLAEKNKAKWGGKYDNGGDVVGYIDLSKEKNVVVNDSGELKDLPIIDIVKKNVIKQYPITIDGSKKAYDLIMNVYGDNIRTYEGFYVIMLNKANKPIYIYEHTKGGQESTIVDVQLVVSAAQKVLAKGVILVHNHPSGSIRPSEADIKITKDLVQALKVFNVKVLDHIIATENGYYSFADEGVLPMAKDGKKLDENKEDEYLTYAESQKKYHERAGTTSLKDKQKMAIDFIKENPEVLLLENGAKLNGVPNVQELAKRKLSGNFELPFEMAIYVPSTKNIDEIIGKDEFTSRIKEVETFVSKIFGGFSTDRVDGGFYSDDRKKLVREDVAKVYVFGSEYDFESKFNQLINKLKQWGKAWSQESMGFEFEGDLYYVSSAKSKSKETTMAHGGRISLDALKEMAGEKPKKLTNREKITMAKAKYSN